ncbi:hypothetical protein U9M48_029028 [Paspalum notatum var. saurae]|uniref:Uncharacterized protein n=1 Tax=Paspalum notatum var. saurae TaxID=547442 RepID=A0AAQ3TXK1_PASNO
MCAPTGCRAPAQEASQIPAGAATSECAAVPRLCRRAGIHFRRDCTPSSGDYATPTPRTASGPCHRPRPPIVTQSYSIDLSPIPKSIARSRWVQTKEETRGGGKASAAVLFRRQWIDLQGTNHEAVEPWMGSKWANVITHR